MLEERCLGWKGLCIEPQRRFAGIIQKSRTCGVVNAAVAESDFSEENSGEIDIVVGGVLGGRKGTLTKERRAFKLAMTYPEHRFSSWISTIDHIRVSGHSHRPLSIDCEGCELAVLNSIDYSEVKIRLMQIERNEKTGKLNHFFLNRGLLGLRIWGKMLYMS